MGTRSLTYFYQNDKPFCAFYRQMDGYPEGHGVELADILAPITLVNGYQMNMKAGEYANGPGCLAAQVIQQLKEESGIGGIYMISPNPEDHTDGWQQYEYHVHIDIVGEGFNMKHVGYIEVFSVGEPNTRIFSGGWNDFLKWASKPKRNKDGDLVPVIKPNIVKLAKPELRTALKKGAVTVTFRKVSGEKRVMKCTQNFELIPEEKHPSSSGRIRHNGDHILMNVFDLEKNDWRSFREDRVVNYEVV